MKTKKAILTVGLSLEEFARVACAFDRQEAEVDNLPAARSALEVIVRRPVECLVVRYPLPDMVLPAFLREVRGGPCRRSPLLLLAEDDRLKEAQRYVGRGANRVIAIGDLPSALPPALMSLLDVAPRKPRQLIAQLRFQDEGAADWLLCRSVNTSTSGVLLASDRRLPTGTRVDFELTLPESDRQVAGRAEITRHTLVGRERVRGMGLRFLSFAAGSRKVYETYLNGQS